MNKKDKNQSTLVLEGQSSKQGDNYINWAKSCKTLSNRNFHWSEDLVELYKDCLLYSAGSLKSPLDSKKGLCIIGSYGTGKTTLMKCLREYEIAKSYKENDIGKKTVNRMITAREAVRQFQRRGSESLDRISYKTIGDGTFPPQGPVNLFIDDIGQCEDFAVYYGTKTNVIKELIADRYDIYCKDGSKTHITSNLTSEMFRERYGDYIASRMNEMFNIIIMNGIDHRLGEVK